MTNVQAKNPVASVQSLGRGSSPGSAAISACLKNGVAFEHALRLLHEERWHEFMGTREHLRFIFVCVEGNCACRLKDLGEAKIFDSAYEILESDFFFDEFHVVKPLGLVLVALM